MFLFSLTRYLGMELQYPMIVLWASLMAQLVKNLPAMQATLVLFLGQEDPLEKGIGYPVQLFLGFPCGSAGKESSCNVEDLGLIRGLGRCSGEGKATHSGIRA